GCDAPAGPAGPAVPAFVTGHDRATLGGAGDALIHVAEHPGALEVVVAQALDLEAGVDDQVADRAVEVAAPADAALEGRQAALPGGDPGVRGQPVLEEVDRATGAHDAA